VEKVRLGKTELYVTRTAFGVLPIQRTEKSEAVRILNAAFDGGINFYDTARAYSDSEDKLGTAMAGKRDKIIIATKTGATDKAGALRDLQTSLANLQTDYIDIWQLHNPAKLPDPNDPESSYAAMLEAKQKGIIRHIGITQHSRGLVVAAANSGLYDTVQFPLNYLSDEKDWELASECKKNDVGLILMKPMSGGLITNLPASFAHLRQYDNVVPIWGIQRMHELEELLRCDKDNIQLTEDLLKIIEADKTELMGNFCRACGYCLPCPAGIPIPMAARMSLLLRRMPYQQFLSPQWQENMRRINDCTHCDNCRSKCPYGINTPDLLKAMLADYEEFITEHKL